MCIALNKVCFVENTCLVASQRAVCTPMGNMNGASSALVASDLFLVISFNPKDISKCDE